MISELSCVVKDFRRRKLDADGCFWVHLPMLRDKVHFLGCLTRCGVNVAHVPHVQVSEVVVQSTLTCVL